MKIIIETKRLVLREFLLVDAEPFFILNNDPEVLKYTGDQEFQSVEAAKDFILNYSDYERNGFGRWAVILKEGNEFIGFCGLKHNEENQVDLGFRIMKKHWNKGFATEAAEACINYGFHHLQIQEIVGRAMPENTASMKVLEKIGMTFWKVGNCEGLSGASYYRSQRINTK